MQLSVLIVKLLQPGQALLAALLQPYVGNESNRATVAGVPRALSATVTTAFLAVQRRHLMAFDRFAPKFMFEFCMCLTHGLSAVVAGTASSL